MQTNLASLCGALGFETAERERRQKLLLQADSAAAGAEPEDDGWGDDDWGDGDAEEETTEASTKVEKGERAELAKSKSQTSKEEDAAKPKANTKDAKASKPGEASASSGGTVQSSEPKTASESVVTGNKTEAPATSADAKTNEGDDDGWSDDDWE